MYIVLYCILVNILHNLYRGEDGNMENTPDIDKISVYYQEVHKWSLVSIRRFVFTTRRISKIQFSTIHSYLVGRMRDLEENVYYRVKRNYENLVVALTAGRIAL